MELTVVNINGENTDKKVSLDGNVFGIEPNDHAIYLDVKQIMANKRQGTHDSRERSDVTGSTRKIKKQKGTGTARFGDIKNPIFRGGGRVFGPHPRDYNSKLNKKLKRLARKSALSYKLKDNEYCNFTTYTTVTILGISLTTNTTDLYTVKNDGTVLEVKNDSITDTWNIKELTKKNLTVEQVKGNVTNHIEATKI